LRFQGSRVLDASSLDFRNISGFTRPITRSSIVCLKPWIALRSAIACVFASFMSRSSRKRSDIQANARAITITSHSKSRVVSLGKYFMPRFYHPPMKKPRWFRGAKCNSCHVPPRLRRVAALSSLASVPRPTRPTPHRFERGALWANLAALVGCELASLRFPEPGLFAFKLDLPEYR